MSYLSKQDQSVKQGVELLQNKFLLGHEKSHIKYKKGIVFIGNSRIGKSTISGYISGIKMSITLTAGELRIQPFEDKYKKDKNFIQHSFTSVTSFPNIHQVRINNQHYTIVDLPGFKDSDPVKELCNWHYIKSILSQLDKILFVMVIQVHSQTKNVAQDQIQMMIRFAKAFPVLNQKPKQNLITIVNFMQGIENQNIISQTKTKISTNIKEKLKKFKLQQYYNSSLTHNKMFLMQRLHRNQNIRQGTLFSNSKLKQFLESNLFYMQNIQQSPYKINLTLQNTKQAQRLKLVIKQFIELMFKNISQKYTMYKEHFAYLLRKLTESSGVKFKDNDYKLVQDLYQEKKLNKYKKLVISQKAIQKYDFEDHNTDLAQQVSYQIAKYVHNMTYKTKKQQEERLQQQNNRAKQGKIITWEQKQRQQQQRKQKRLIWLQGQFIKLMKLIQILYKQTFEYMQYQKLQEYNETIRKSLYIEFYNLLYIHQSVENYQITYKNQDNQQIQTSLSQQYNFGIKQLYQTTYVRVDQFQRQLKDYYLYLFNIKTKQPVNKINLHLLQQLKHTSTLLHFKTLRFQCALLLYLKHHQKLQYHYNNLNFHQFAQSINIITKQKEIFSQQQLQFINNWKLNKLPKTSNKNNKANTNNINKPNNTNQLFVNPSAWTTFKIKHYLVILKSLKLTSYNKKQLLQKFLKFKSQSSTILQILQQISQDVKYLKFDKYDTFQLCIKASDHLVLQYQFNKAQECCRMAANLYEYEDQAKVTEAKMRMIKILKLQNTFKLFYSQQQKKQIKELIKQSPWPSLLFFQQQIKQQISKNPWPLIQDNQYTQVIQTMKKYTNQLQLLGEKQTNFIKRKSGQTNLQNSRGMQVNSNGLMKMRSVESMNMNLGSRRRESESPSKKMSDSLNLGGQRMHESLSIKQQKEESIVQKKEKQGEVRIKGRVFKSMK